MATVTKQKSKQTRLIEDCLADHFSEVEAYRYNIASIRVRVLDIRFKGLSNPEREELILPLLANLPQEVRDDITILLLLAPSEAKRSMMNLEFEQPTPSRV